MKLTKQLRQASYVQTRGEPTQIFFVEADKMTDAVQSVSDYTIEGDTLKISVILVKNNQPIGKEIVVTGNVSKTDKAIMPVVESMIKYL